MNLLAYDSDSENDELNDATESLKSNSSEARETISSSNVIGYVAASTTHKQKMSHPLLDNLPTTVEGNNNSSVIDNIKQFSIHGSQLSEKLRANKSFGNPYILTKIVSTLAIDEIGSNYPKHLFDPHSYSKEDYLDAIIEKYSQASSSVSGISMPSTTLPPVSTETTTTATTTTAMIATTTTTTTTTTAVNPMISDMTLAAASAIANKINQQLSIHQQPVPDKSKKNIIITATDVVDSSTQQHKEPKKKKSRWDSRDT